MGLSDKRVAVLVAPGFEDSELLQPIAALQDAGVRVKLIGLKESDRRGLRGKRGSLVRTDMTIDAAHHEDFDAVMIPGGKAPAHLRKDERVLDFVRGFDRAGKTVAAICHGPQVLASAGLLEGRTATSFFTVSREVRRAGAHFVSRPVIIDGNLITSRNPRDIPQFTRAILEALSRAPARKSAA